MLSPNELIAFLSRYQFLTSVQAETLNRDRSQYVSAMQLCGDLLQRGWITPYQQAQLLSGHGEKLVIGSYRIQAPLGEGGMGMVFKAVQPKLDRIVAVKIIRPQVLAARPEILSRFHREAKAIAQLNHPNVVILYDADEVNGIHYIAMEYVEGQTLEKLVRSQGPLSIKQACEYMRQAAHGLQHAYEVGLVHRDIKPSNILVAQKSPTGGTVGKSSARLPRPLLRVPQGSGTATATAPASNQRIQHNFGQVKILDMGLARLVEGGGDGPQQEFTPLTRAGALLGTPDFIAPEQARDARAVDIRADIYSLGCTLYYILTGKPPFPGGTDVQKLIKHQSERPYPIEDLRPGIATEVAQVLNRMLAKRPDDRYATPQHLADVLEAFLYPSNPGTPVHQPPPIAETPPVAETPVPNPAVAPPRPPSAHRPPASSPAPSIPSYLPRAPIPAPAASESALSRETQKVPVDFFPIAEAVSVHSDPMGTRVVTAADLFSGRPRATFTAHTGVVSTVAFSGDGQLLATGGIDGRVRLWDIAGSAPREIATFPRPGAEFQSLAFSPQGTFLAAGGTLQGTARVWRWNWREGKVAEWGAYQGDKAGVTAMTFSADGRRFAACIGSFVILWKVSGQVAGRGTILKGHPGRTRAVAFSRDGKRMVSAGEGRLLLSWSFGWFGPRIRSRFRAHTDIITSVAFSKDSARIATVGLDKAILVWDAANPSNASSISLVGHSDNLRLVRFLEDGSTLVSVGESGHVVHWNHTAALKIEDFHLGQAMASSVDLSRDGRLLATATTDGRVNIFDTARGPSPVTIGR